MSLAVSSPADAMLSLRFFLERAAGCLQSLIFSCCLLSRLRSMCASMCRGADGDRHVQLILRALHGVAVKGDTAVPLDALGTGLRAKGLLYYLYCIVRC